MVDDLEARIAEIKQEIKYVVNKINSFDIENDSIEEIVQYQKLLNCLKERVSDLIDEVDIEIVLESVNQSLIDEGYIK